VPVQRFRDLDDARRALWTTADDPRLLDRLRHLWRFTARLVRSRPSPGLRRFRTIEEANADRERSVATRIRGATGAGRESL
jgi:hypothetical protein